ncbi:ribonuclease P protein component [Blattabacterium cuenoti]|uniref:ribonuclease P protein component n=1 Tax=Blattabacterium cuenoti TaxID=1653831 RepID=UPI00163C3A8A|nr:ribonuclease P protein component [Blattabacterium cuenoti]
MQFKKKKIFEKIIKNGDYSLVYPVLSVFFKTNYEKKLSLKLVGTLVKKKNFKKSVHRNRIKRLLKASFILNKSILDKYIINQNYYIILIYKAFYLPKFKDVNESIISIFNKKKSLLKQLTSIGPKNFNCKS